MRSEVELWKRAYFVYREFKSICDEINGQGRIKRGRKRKQMPQEPISITGLMIKSNHTGEVITISVEVDGKFHDIAQLKGSGQEVISHIIEPLGIRSVIEGSRNPIHV